MPTSLVIQCAKWLAEKRMTIAFAESATAGRAAAEFALTPDSGKILTGGLVCYDAKIKETVLGVAEELVKKCTPESPEVTQAIACNLKKIIQADIYVGITGLTCPGGSETEEKPVGTMFVHIHSAKKDETLRLFFKGDPESIVMQTIDALSEAICRHV